MRRSSMVLRGIVLCLAVCSLAVWTGCGSSKRACTGDQDCQNYAPQIHCLEGFCSEQECVVGRTDSCYEGDAKTLGVGNCLGGMRFCTFGGRWSACQGQSLPRQEICDRADNDCNGKVDDLPGGESCICETPGERRLCYSAQKETDGKGICRAGIQYCELDSLWGPCRDQQVPEVELCDGIDNNCNGKIDDHSSCRCEPGQKQGCWLYLASQRGKGACKDGTQTCGADNTWGECTGGTAPTKEVCANSKDDNCDGFVDEGCSEACDKGLLLCGGNCVDAKTSNAHCGACNTSCNLSKGERCVDGACKACPADASSLCGSACVNLRSDSAHCGKCNNACDTSKQEACVNGVCQTCPAQCGGSCVDLQTDSSHCGACDKACAAGASCKAGVCTIVCTAGKNLCGSDCVDLKSDTKHCGKCDNQCSVGSGETCSAGTCHPIHCGGTHPTICGAACVNTNTDAKHCGFCNNACPAGQGCTGGTCKLVCGGTTPTLCGDACVNTDVNRLHCGGCSQACPTGEVCLSAKCEQSCGGKTPKLCGDSCVDQQTDPRHCGACDNKCGLREVCQAGSCVCQKGDSRPCFTVDASKRNKGSCRDGVQMCEESGQTTAWGACAGEVKPVVQEDCDGQDDDCNGVIDDNLKAAASCASNIGICTGARQTCKQGRWVCDVAKYEVNETMCDGVDNDCDGFVDENLKGMDCAKQKGVCAGAKQSCRSGSFGACTPIDYGLLYEEQGETLCDGKDNDCDGTVDEGCQSCYPTLRDLSFKALHGGGLGAVAVHPSAVFVAASSESGDLVLWRAGSGTAMGFYPQSAKVQALAFHPKGELLAAGDANGRLRLWRVNDFVAQPVLVVNAHSTGISAVAFRPDGKQFATVSAGDATNGVKIWDLGGQLVQTLTGHSDRVRDIAWHKDGKLLVSGSADKSARIWDTTTGMTVQKMTGHTKGITAVAWSPDGIHVATGSEDTDIKLWDGSTGSLKGTLAEHFTAIGDLAFNFDGSILASVASQADYSIHLYDMKSYKVHRTTYGAVWQLNVLAWSPNGKSLYAGSSDKYLHKFGCVTGCPTSNFTQNQMLTEYATNKAAFNDTVSTIAFTLAGDYMVTGDRSGRMIRWSGTPEPSGGMTWSYYSLLNNVLGASQPISSISFSPYIGLPGRCFVIAGDTQKKAIGRKIGNNADLGFSPDDTQGGHSAPLTQVAFDTRTAYFATASQDGTVRTWFFYAASPFPARLHMLHSLGSPVNTIAWSPNGLRLASGGENKQVKVWDTTNMQANANVIKTPVRLHSESDKIISISWHPASTHYVVASGGRTLKIHPAPGVSGSIVTLPANTEHTAELTKVAWSPDGRWILSASLDKTIKIWSPQGGASKATIAGTASSFGAITSLQWHPSGLSFAFGSDDKTLRVWSCNIP